ncbi:MAG TPA: hypothetical protein VNS58_08005 [Puia sp.]|nr:hypothetical protein [Puia sp.]
MAPKFQAVGSVERPEFQERKSGRNKGARFFMKEKVISSLPMNFNPFSMSAPAGGSGVFGSKPGKGEN